MSKKRKPRMQFEWHEQLQKRNRETNIEYTYHAERMNIFRLHSNCPAKFKLITADAVIRTKLFYGTVSAQLGEGELKRFDTIQLKISRKMLGLKTTFVDREKRVIGKYGMT